MWTSFSSGQRCLEFQSGLSLAGFCVTTAAGANAKTAVVKARWPAALSVIVVVINATADTQRSPTLAVLSKLSIVGNGARCP